MQITEIEIFDSPRELGHYKCLVCENKEIARGWDGTKGEFIYLTRLHKVEVGMKWIFFCDSCYYQLKKSVGRT